MYDPILARSFSKNDQKKMAVYAFLVCLIVGLTLCTVFRPQFYSSVLDLNLSTSFDLDMVAVGDSSPISNQLDMSETTILSPIENEIEVIPIISQQFPLPSSTHVINTKVICSISEPLSDYCEIEGDIIIIGNSSTILVPSSSSNIFPSGNSSWKIKPYARKGNVEAMNAVREWKIQAIDKAHESIPSCTKSHTHPAILFSTGGFSGNYFHGFSDVLVPLFSNSRIFNGNVHILATDYKGWWISKFQKIFDDLSDHKVIDIDKEKDVQCYKRLKIGLRSNKELGIDESKSPHGYSMKDFRGFLRKTYSLEREKAIIIKKDDKKKPRLMIISRSKTRKLLNELEISKMAQSLGCEVVVAEASGLTNISRFMEVVNSCDVFMGVHGAGLTNMIFLPDNAVVIQVVPLGGIEGFANTCFGEPSKDMDLRYLSYKIGLNESSLMKQYPLDHQVLRDPLSVHRQGWDAVKTRYLDNQDVMLDVPRFRLTLSSALKILQQ